MNFQAKVIDRRDSDKRTRLTVETQHQNDKYPTRYNLDFKPDSDPKGEVGDWIDISVPDYINRIRSDSWIYDGKAMSRIVIWEPKLSFYNAGCAMPGAPMSDTDIPF